MTTISKGAASFVPELVTGYESTRQSGNIIHKIIGRADPDVTFKAAGLRTGSLEMLFLSHTPALAAEALLAAPGVFTLADPDVPGINMKFVTQGDIVTKLDPETRELWTVTSGFQEVL